MIHEDENYPQPTAANDPNQNKMLQQRNVALGAALGAFVVLIAVVTFLRLSEMTP